tara:strand:+ start:2405 stop:2638 length:234 start_codon:yes stop_codon:yes gene_type:complete
MIDSLIIVGISLASLVIGYVLAVFSQRGMVLMLKEQLLDKEEEINTLKVKYGLDDIDWDYNGWEEDIVPLDNKPVKN